MWLWASGAVTLAVESVGATELLAGRLPVAGPEGVVLWWVAFEFRGCGELGEGMRP